MNILGRGGVGGDTRGLKGIAIWQTSRIRSMSADEGSNCKVGLT
jgi:hypothetical protein